MQAQRAGRGNPPPVAKQEAPTVEQILKMATAQATATGTMTRTQLEALATAHPSEPVFYQAYRVYHLGQGQADAVLGDKAQR